MILFFKKLIFAGGGSSLLLSCEPQKGLENTYEHANIFELALEWTEDTDSLLKIINEVYPRTGNRAIKGICTQLKKKRTAEYRRITSRYGLFTKF